MRDTELLCDLDKVKAKGVVLTWHPRLRENCHKLSHVLSQMCFGKRKLAQGDLAEGTLKVTDLPPLQFQSVSLHPISCWSDPCPLVSCGNTFKKVIVKKSAAATEGRFKRQPVGCLSQQTIAFCLLCFCQGQRSKKHLSGLHSRGCCISQHLMCICWVM